jgi:hypothetical protein
LINGKCRGLDEAQHLFRRRDVESRFEYAGEDAERARYYPADEEYLLEKEQRATHYEVLV